MNCLTLVHRDDFAASPSLDDVDSTVGRRSPAALKSTAFLRFSGRRGSEANRFARELTRSAEEPVSTNSWIVDSAFITRLAKMSSSRVDIVSLVRICNEINVTCVNRNLLATVLLMQAMLEHIAPVFG
jgi:hypothetical protein